MIWKKVVGWPYEVSDIGVIRNTRTGLVLSPGTSKNGYRTVRLYDDGKANTFYVHRLVARAFLGTCAVDRQVNHKSGVKLENSATNLECVTASENHRHAYRNGLRRQKLSLEVAEQIRMDYRGGITQTELAKKHGVQRVVINKICNGKLWRPN